MTDDYATLVDAAVAHARAGQAAVAEIFVSNGRDFDVEHGLIQFLLDDQPFVDAEAICVGSFAFGSGSWMWSWAIESIPPGLRKGAERLRDLAGSTGHPEFADENAFVTPEPHAWELAAIACQHLGGRAVYAAPFEDRRLYFSIQSLTSRQPPDALEAAADRAVRDALRTGRGAELLNLMRRRFPEWRLSLVDADLRGAAHPWAHDLHAQPAFDYEMIAQRQPHDLTQANFDGLRLDGAILRGAVLRGASFEGASLVGADLSACDLRGASLRSAFLNGTNFTRAQLEGADVTGAELSRTLLTDVDLSKVLGLDHAAHMAPSEISFSTLVASGFDVAPEFLLKAGVSRGLIEDLANGKRFAAAYQTCFLSYSSKDAAFAGRLYRSLSDAGVRVFWDRLDVVPGDYLERQIVQAIRESKRLMVVLSAASMASEWVEREIRTAWHHNQQSLLPMRLCPIEDVKAWTHDRKLPDLGSLFPVHDFSNWHDADEYQRGVTLMLKSLSSGGVPMPAVSQRS